MPNSNLLVVRPLLCLPCLLVLGWLAPCVFADTADPPEGSAQDRQVADAGDADRASLRQAEIAFAASAADGDPERFRSFLDDQAIFAGGGQPLRGAQAILAGWASFFLEDGPSIHWQPASVEVHPDGLLGMTRGPYTIRSAPDDAPRTTCGTFFSVWRRASRDAPWRVVLDNGAPGPCPPPTE